MFMRMMQGTFLSHGKPPGMPSNLDLVGKASQSAAPNLDQERIGAMEDQATALWEEKNGRVNLPTNHFGMCNVKETIRNKTSTPMDESPTLSLLSSVDLYWKSQLFVEYSKDLHIGVILDGMHQ